MDIASFQLSGLFFLSNFVAINYIKAMNINYEVHEIENAQGRGEARAYVSLRTSKSKTIDEMSDMIERATTVTAADVKAVMSEFCHVAVGELSSGCRVHIPGLGYLSLSAAYAKTENNGKGEITGKDIFVRSIRFKPEARFLSGVRKRSSFRKSRDTSVSVRYRDVDIWQAVSDYLSTHDFVTRRIMCEQFGLSDYMAARWLDVFVASQRLAVHKIGRQKVYRRE